MDIFWLLDKSLADLDNLPEPDDIATEIIDYAEAGLACFREITGSWGNFKLTREVVMPITEQMILECYEAWRIGNRNCVPEGMNASSAAMTMLWLDSLFHGRPYHRDGSSMQYKVILERIREDYGSEQARFARDVLLEHCKWSLERHGKPMHRHRDVLRHF